MKRTLLTVCVFLAGAVILQAQPTITAVQNESGSNSLCPGGIAFVKGTGLGNTSTKVTVAGKQAYVFNGGATQLQVELPVDAPLGATTVTAGASAPFNITLVQYCPAIAINNGITAAVHYPSGTPVTASFPASPNEQIGLIASGLGPTNPVIPTGQAPNDNSAVAVTLPTVSEGGKPATVSTAFIQAGNNAGFFVVVFTVRSDATTGSPNVSISIGGLTSNAGPLPISTGPIITSVTNAGSYIDPSLPNGPIAQGAIFVVKGSNMGPSAITIDSKPFQNTSLSGTSLSVTVNGTAVAALMYYTSAGQLAALLPSNTPVGTGTITATYNGQAGPAAPIRVVASNLGIFTLTSDGGGAGIVTYPDYSLVSTTKAANCGGPSTTCGAANPGDTLTLWATGLGPISGNDAKGDGLGVDLTSSVMPALWLGGVQAPVIFSGRGCCIGEDQIAFTIPASAPTGCAVPLSVQIGNYVSNSVAIPIAAAGSRTCAPADPTFTAAEGAAIASGGGTFNYGEIDLKHRDTFPPPGYQDVIAGQFFHFSVPAAALPFLISDVDQPPLGTCQVFNNLNGSNPPLNLLAQLDVGSSFTVQGPNGSKNAPLNGGKNTTLSANGTYLTPGAYTVSAPGGKDVPAFNASLTIPAMPTLTVPPPDAANPFSVTRSGGLTVNWTGGQAAFVQIEVFNSTDNTNTIGADISCYVPAGPGTFTVPANVLLALPAGNFGGGMAFRTYANPVNFTSSALNLTKFAAWNATFAPLTFK